MDEHDRFCMHLLAFDSDKPIGTCRIDLLQGRLAVLAPHRRHGIGKLLMSHLHKIAQNKNIQSVWCHAQVDVVPFYKKLGYREVGSHFYEANIEHVTAEIIFD